MYNIDMFKCSSRLYYKVSADSLFRQGLGRKGALFVGGVGLGYLLQQQQGWVCRGARPRVVFAVEQNIPLKEKITSASHSSFPHIFHAETEEEKKVMIQKLEIIFGHIVGSLKIPFMNPETQQVQSLGLFEAIDQIVQTHDSQAKVYLGGGSIRSIFSYIYQEIYRAHGESGLSCEELLDRFSQGTFKVRNEDLHAAAVLGVRSDLDIFVDSSDSQLQRVILQKVKRLINQGEDKFQEPLHTAVFPPADVQDYETHLQRASSCGGSPLDWLAFPLTKRSGSHFVIPKTRPSVLDELCDGKIGYASTKKAESLELTTLRMYRSICELPFLSLSEEDELRFINDLKKIQKNFSSSGGDIDPRVHAVFQKILRNTRFPDRYNEEVAPCIVSEVCPERRRIISDITRLSSGSGSELPELVPANTKKTDLDLEMIALLEKRNLFMEEETFIRDYTDSGMLYHGTKKLEDLLPMSRGNLVFSSSSQGVAACGRGFYTTAHLSTARGYAMGQEASILKIPVKKGGVKVVEWRSMPSDMKEMVEKKAESKGMEPFQYLEKCLGVNVVINDHILIQNTSALVLQEKKPAELVDLVVSESISKIVETMNHIKLSNPDDLYSHHRDLIKKVKDLQKSTLRLQSMLSKELYEQAEAAKNNGIKMFQEALRDKRFCAEALGGRLINADEVDPSFWENESFALSVLERGYDCFHKLSPNLRKDRAFALQAVNRNYSVMKYVDTSFKEDRDFVLEAVRQNGCVFLDIIGCFQDDPEIVLEAVAQNSEIWSFVDNRFQADRDFALKALSRNGDLFLKFSLRWRADREFASLAVSKDSDNFRFMGGHLKDDLEMVLPLLSKKGALLKEVSGRLKSDPQVVQVAIGSDPKAIQWAGSSLLNNYDFMLKNCSDFPESLSFVGEKLQRHRGFTFEMLERGSLFKYGNESWKKQAVQEIMRRPMKNLSLNLPSHKSYFSRSWYTQVHSKV